MHMRRRTRIGVMLGACGVLSGMWMGCTAKKQTELVAGVSTQVRVPKDLKSVRIDAQSGGINVFCGVYDVTNGIARLPKTLALQAAHDPKLPVTITVTGFPGAPTDNDAPTALTSCVSTGTPRVKARGQGAPSDPLNPPVARVLRASRQPYVADKVLFLPMPLRFSCFERDCTTGPNGGPEKTCKAGKCVDPDLDSSTLAEYQDAFIFGNSNTCFSPRTCLPDGVPPQLVDRQNCIYALPNTASAPPAGPIPQSPTNGTGLNVRAVFDDGSTSEVLDLDKDEGYFIPDPEKPQRFQLADGLCHPDSDAAHRIVGLVSSGLCPSKTPLQPVCDDESAARGDDSGAGTAADGAACNPLEIQPSPSALLLLVDRSERMSRFFSEETAQKVLSLSLSDPAFQNTVIGLEFFPRKDVTSAAVCSGGAPFSTIGASDVKFGEARNVQKTIADVVKATTTAAAGSQTEIDAALALNGGVYGALTQFASQAGSPQFNRLAVLVLGATDYGQQQCGGGNLASLESDVHAAFLGGPAAAPPIPSVSTYVVNFPNGSNVDVGGVAGEALASAGGTEHVFNTATSSQAGPDAFQKVVADLASCLYEAPGNTCHINPTTGVLVCAGGDATVDAGLSIGYYDPLSFTRHSVAPNVDRTAKGCAGKSRGWNFDSKGRIQICGNDCEDLRNVLRIGGEAATALGLPPPAVPLYLTNCGGASTGGFSSTGDSGTSTGEGGFGPGEPDASNPMNDAGFGSDGSGLDAAPPADATPG